MECYHLSRVKAHFVGCLHSTKLSNSDIYDLSQKPPNWSDMDPYSGLEEENEDVSNTADQSDNIIITKSLKAMPLPRSNKLVLSASSSENFITPPIVSSTRYQLWEQKSITTPLSIKMSDRSRSKSVNYTDYSDDDSDYEPKPKRIRNPNVGLREPSSQ